MAKAPAFQFYPQDFLVGTANFKPEERGAYISLLCYQWEQGGINPEDFEQLSGVDLGRLGKVVNKFELCEDGIYRNKRLEEIRARQINFSKKQSDKVKKRYQTSTEPLPDGLPTSYQTPTNKGTTFLEDRSMKHEDSFFEKEGVEEKTFFQSDDEKLTQYSEWAEAIFDNNDQYFLKAIYRAGITPEQVTRDIINRYLQLLAEYPKKRPPSAQAFRMALIGFITEKKNDYKNGNIDGKNLDKNGHTIIAGRVTKEAATELLGAAILHDQRKKNAYGDTG